MKIIEKIETSQYESRIWKDVDNIINELMIKYDRKFSIKTTVLRVVSKSYREKYNKKIDFEFEKFKIEFRDELTKLLDQYLEYFIYKYGLESDIKAITHKHDDEMNVAGSVIFQIKNKKLNIRLNLWISEDEDRVLKDIFKDNYPLFNIYELTKTFLKQYVISTIVHEFVHIEQYLLSIKDMNNKQFYIIPDKKKFIPNVYKLKLIALSKVDKIMYYLSRHEIAAQAVNISYDLLSNHPKEWIFAKLRTTEGIVELSIQSSRFKLYMEYLSYISSDHRFKYIRQYFFKTLIKQIEESSSAVVPYYRTTNTEDKPNETKKT